MPDPADAFLDAAVRAFDDNAELQIIARRQLAEWIADTSDAGVSLAEATRRFDDVDRQRPTIPGRWWAVLLLPIFAGLTAWSGFGFYQHRNEIGWLSNLDNNQISHVDTDRLSAGMSAEQSLVFHGDAETLWQTDRADPVFFANHVRQKGRLKGPLPADLLDQAEEIDPGNGYFAFRAAVASSGGISIVPHPRVKGVPRPVSEWQIKDETRWLESLTLLEQVASAPEFRSYQRELLQRRIELLPLAKDTLEQVTVRHYFRGITSAALRNTALACAVAAKAERCLKEGDAEGLRKLIVRWDKVCSRHLRDLDGLIVLPIESKLLMIYPLGNFIASAEGLGMAEEVRMLRERRQRLEERPREMALSEPEETERLMERRAGHIAYHELGRTGLEAVPGELELRPGRLADHELMNRVVAFALSCLLALTCAGVALYRFRSTTFARRLSHRVSKLFTPVDFGWIIGAGVLLPYALMQMLNRLTPLGGRDWSFSVHGGMATTGQHLAAALLMLLLPALLASWRAGHRVAVLGMKAGRSVAGWTAVIGGILALAMFGIALFANPSGMLFKEGALGGFDHDFVELNPTEVGPPGFFWVWIAVLLLVLMTVTLVAFAVRAAFTRRTHLLRRMVVSRLLLPAYACGALLFAVESPLCHAAERHWVAQDHLLRPRADLPGPSEIEFKETERYREHLLGILNSAP